MSRANRAVERRILRLLHDRNARAHLHEIHARILRHGLHHSPTVLAHFISVCAKLRREMSYAELLFHRAHNGNLHIFNSMIKGYSLYGPFERSLGLFCNMKGVGVLPDQYTFAPLIKSCCGLGEFRVGQCVHCEVIKVGLDRRGAIRVGFVEFYAGCERMEDARKVFDEMSQRDVIVWNLMVRGYCKIGDVDMGLGLFRQMGDRTVVSWNSMINSLAKSGRDNEALELFREMRVHGFEPDEVTVVTILPVCGRLGAVDDGKWAHSYARSSGLFRDLVTVGNAIVTFYCKCGDLEAAYSVFREMPRRNVISWNAIISGLAVNGMGELGLQLFEEMISRGVKPTESSFVGVLTCCAHMGLVQKGRDLFDSMTITHRIQPRLEHYGCMTDLLGRVGCLREAHDLIKSMPMRPSAALWGSLLSASRTYGDAELAECAAKELIKLEPWNSGNYVLLSNIYAEEGRWNEVDRVRLLMKERSIRKSAGQSMVQ